MKKFSEKLADYIMKTGVITSETYEVYQYGFQIGLEMLICFLTSLLCAVYLHMISEFFISIIIFMALRTYAGGLHLNSFFSCFLCSVIVQTLILITAKKVQMNIIFIGIIIGLCLWGIIKKAPIENVNHELDDIEREYYKKCTKKITGAIGIISALLLTIGNENYLVVIMLTVSVILFSQYAGEIRHKMQKKI